MPRTATRKKLKTYHASVYVTRLEQWTIEAANEREARELLHALSGHCTQHGEVVHSEVDVLEEV